MWLQGLTERVREKSGSDCGKAHREQYNRVVLLHWNPEGESCEDGKGWMGWAGLEISRPGTEQTQE